MRYNRYVMKSNPKSDVRIVSDKTGHTWPVDLAVAGASINSPVGYTGKWGSARPVTKDTDYLDRGVWYKVYDTDRVLFARDAHTVNVEFATDVVAEGFYNYPIPESDTFVEIRRDPVCHRWHVWGPDDRGHMKEIGDPDGYPHHTSAEAFAMKWWDENSEDEPEDDLDEEEEIPECGWVYFWRSAPYPADGRIIIHPVVPMKCIGPVYVQLSRTRSRYNDAAKELDNARPAWRMVHDGDRFSLRGRAARGTYDAHDMWTHIDQYFDTDNRDEVLIPSADEDMEPDGTVYGPTHEVPDDDAHAITPDDLRKIFIGALRMAILIKRAGDSDERLTAFMRARRWEDLAMAADALLNAGDDSIAIARNDCPSLSRPGGG